MNIETIKSVYFVGAGGIGMSALVVRGPRGRTRG